MAKRFAEAYDEWSYDADKKKKRKSRWGNSEPAESNILTGLPTVIPQGLTKEQEELYLLQLQIEEITRRLKTGELGIPPNPEDRSPSPEPIYNNEGKRLNTREFRTRKKLEEERHNLVQKVLKVNPEYKPPADYRPPLIRINDKVMIPQDEHPEINFVGLLIGPRGNTLRNLEKETGTSIIIRGKGSVKEGKVGHKDGKPLPGQDEPLHAYITANSCDNVKKAVKRIKEIIQEGIDVPDADNDLRKQQLRELALLNGTLREGDALTKLKQFQEAQTIVTNTILCIICGGAGHISADCKQRRPGETLKEMAMNPQIYNPNEKAKMDSEYMSLMAELGQGNGGPPPHPNSVRMRTPLQLPNPSRPQLSITGGSSGGWSAPPPPGPPSSFSAPPPPALNSSSNQNSSFTNNSAPPPWKGNSAGPMSLPPPVRPQPPSNNQYWQAPPPPSTGGSGGNQWSGGGSSWSGGSSSQNSSSWSGSNPSSSGGSNWGGGNSWGGNSSSGGGQYGSGSGGGSHWMSRPPVPPTPPSFNQWSGSSRMSHPPPPPN